MIKLCLFETHEKSKSYTKIYADTNKAEFLLIPMNLQTNKFSKAVDIVSSRLGPRS